MIHHEGSNMRSASNKSFKHCPEQYKLEQQGIYKKYTTNLIEKFNYTFVCFYYVLIFRHFNSNITGGTVSRVS